MITARTWACNTLAKREAARKTVASQTARRIKEVAPVNRTALPGGGRRIGRLAGGLVAIDWLDRFSAAGLGCGRFGIRRFLAGRRCFVALFRLHLLRTL